MMRRICGVLAALCLVLLACVPATAQRKSASLGQVTFTATAGAYGTGECLGGVLSVPNMLRPQNQGGALLAGVTFLDSAHNTAANDAMNLLVFGAKPTGTYTDQAACAIAAADRPNFLGYVAIASSNCVQDSGPATTVCTITPSLPINAVSQPIAAPTLYVVPVLAATPTYGAITLYFDFFATPLGGN